jgi:IclR family transcriptional regulator, KDG regulon repressor
MAAGRDLDGAGTQKKATAARKRAAIKTTATGERETEATTAKRPVPKTNATGERETSIRRGVEVLLSLASEESLSSNGLGVTQIADLLGREKSQVSRALKALSEYGLVERNQDSSYRLGWRLYALAQLAGERRLLEVATPIMRRLAYFLAERVHLSVLQGTDALTVISESPGRSVETVGWAGRVTPAYCTSAGRALLLDWEADEIAAAFANVEFVALGPRTVRSPKQLFAAIRADRQREYVVVDGEFEPDLIGVAVPVRDARHSIIASLNVSAPRYRFVERVSDAGQELLEVSAALSQELGDPGVVALPARGR